MEKLSDKLDSEDDLTKEDVEEFMKAVNNKFLDRKILDAMKPKDKNNWILIINKLSSASKDFDSFDPEEDIDSSFNKLYDIADDNNIFISTF